MRAVVVKVVDVDAGEPDGVHFVEHYEAIEELATQPPIHRSAIGFCQGLRKAVRRGLAPIDLMDPTALLKIESRSKIKCLGAVS